MTTDEQNDMNSTQQTGETVRILLSKDLIESMKARITLYLTNPQRRRMDGIGYISDETLTRILQQLNSTTPYTPSKPYDQ